LRFASLAREGGLPSTFWAGPETIARSVRQGLHAIEGLAKRKVASLKLGFGGDIYGYSIDLGYPPPPPPATMFELDPRVKRECVWHGPVYRKASALVDRRNNFVWLSTTRDEEPVMLTQHLPDTDSMLASISDPQRAPEMLAVREGVRGWRFYDHFRTDSDSPARAAQIGTFTPVLHHDGSNLAAALQTIVEIRSDEALATTLEDAFPGSRVPLIRPRISSNAIGTAAFLGHPFNSAPIFGDRKAATLVLMELGLKRRLHSGICFTSPRTAHPVI
jgi:predicted ATPase